MCPTIFFILTDIPRKNNGFGNKAPQVLSLLSLQSAPFIVDWMGLQILKRYEKGVVS